MPRSSPPRSTPGEVPTPQAQAAGQRPGHVSTQGSKTGVVRPVLTALKMLAQRHQFLTTQADVLEDQLRDLVAMTNPALLSAKGVGPITAAQLLVTAGGNLTDSTARPPSRHCAAQHPCQPRPARPPGTGSHEAETVQANSALHTIAIVRMSSDTRTRHYCSAQRAKGRATPRNYSESSSERSPEKSTSTSASPTPSPPSTTSGKPGKRGTSR